MSKAKDKLVKPRLSSTIYVAFECRGCTDIYPEQVIAKGEDLFFHTGILDASLVDEYKVPLYYKDYNSGAYVIAIIKIIKKNGLNL